MITICRNCLCGVCVRVYNVPVRADTLTTVSLIHYNCCLVPYSQVEFTIVLQRKSLYYIINLVMPCCVFSVLSVITFILPPACGERVGVGK